MQPSRLTPELVEQYTRPGLWEDHLVDDYVAEAARRHPDKVAFVDRGRTLTFRDMEDQVSRVASVLRGLGVQPGEAVSWQLPNWVEGVVLHHAALRIGAVSNPIVAIYREREVGFIVRQARSRVFFVPSTFRNFDYAAMVEKLRPDLPDLTSVVLVGGRAREGFLSFDALVADAEPTAPEPGRSANDVVLLLYTSGTTSDPKGALHTHNTLDYENRSIIDLFGLDGSDVIFMPSPLTHITGLLYGVQLPFMLASTVVLQDVWNATEAVSLIDRHRCTFCVGATPFLHGILEETERRPAGDNPLRVFGCGGADVPPELIRRATTHLNAFVTRVYGSTEYPTATSSAPDDPLEKRATTDGSPIADAQTRIVTADGAEAPAGVEGELQVRGPELFLGYLDEGLNPASFTDDGWFRTGDVAVFDNDGFMRIAGRIKDIIIRGGENISAKEIEDLIFEHPKVAEVSVVGVPDPVMVERICAVVVPREGAEITLSELVEFLSGHGIARQKLPESLVLERELPKTASGKIQKFRLREHLRGLRAQEASR
jgi:cyclohexanecarboxylate-CoA ligase